MGYRPLTVGAFCKSRSLIYFRLTVLYSVIYSHRALILPSKVWCMAKSPAELFAENC